MATIKEYNVKLKSLNNTEKITRTMKMVSASKLRRAQEAQANAKLYAQNVTDLTSRIARSVDDTMHSLLTPREEVKSVLILIITSDRGLCGAFNNNANKRVLSWIEENRHHEQIDISCCGKRGYVFFRKRENIKIHYDNVTINPTYESAVTIGDDLSRDFISGQYDEVYLTYNQFLSPLVQETIFEKILPIDPKSLIKDEEVDRKQTQSQEEYIFEPEVEKLVNFLIPHYLYFKVYFALLENSAGEHGARMSAMDSASKNAADLIDQYTLLRNRARQAQITTELTEIVSGAEAIK